MTSSNFLLYTIQTTIPEEQLNQKLQLMHERFGECTQFNERITIYEKKMQTIQITDQLEDKSDTHKVMTLSSSLKKLKNLSRPREPNQKLDITFQNAVLSTIKGDVHAFFRTLGCNPSRTWIEKGYLFNSELTQITIKIFQVFSYDNKELCPGVYAISIQQRSNYEIDQTDLREYFSFLCNGCEPYILK